MDKRISANGRPQSRLADEPSKSDAAAGKAARSSKNERERIVFPFYSVAPLETSLRKHGGEIFRPSENVQTNCAVVSGESITQSKC
jgi:hypothetical protein